MSDLQLFATRLGQLAGADSARICSTSEEKYLILGTKRSTREDTGGRWVDENGQEQHWDYFAESVTAKGLTPREIYYSLHRHLRLKAITDPERRLKVLLNWRFP